MIMKSSRLLHNNMLYSIMRSSMSFFESTPTGRIINRFSKDIEQIESVLPNSYKGLTRCLLQVLTTIIMIALPTPYFLAVMIPIGAVYILVQVN
jgi:ATP-binding cassette, subfamily C (CFTR/MRP), member 1